MHPFIFVWATDEPPPAPKPVYRPKPGKRSKGAKRKAKK